MSTPRSSVDQGPIPKPITSPPAAATASSSSWRTFHEDVVRRTGKDNSTGQDHCGVVLKRWKSEEGDGYEHEHGSDKHGLDRPLEVGEIGVLWSSSDAREIVQEAEVEVVDRSLHVGDVCKKSHKDKASCVVVKVERQLTLEHVISKKRIPHPVPADHVQNAIRLTRGDYVAAQDWIGIVEEIFEEALVESSDSEELTTICDVGTSLPVGEAKQETIRESFFIWESQFPSGRAPRKVTILDVRQVAICINWIAMNQRLTPQEQENRPRPKHYWTTDINRLTLIRSFSDYWQSVGDRVIFRSQALADQHGAEATRHGPEGVAINVLHVVETSTKAHVIWQDGTRTVEDSVALIPYINIDEYEAWPGDWVLWQCEDAEPQTAIVQRMNPEDRTAEIRLYSTGAIELVPVLEINVHGPDPDTFGIHRGDVVMIDNKPHGMPLPSLPRVGQGEDLPSEMLLQGLVAKRGIELIKKYPGRTPLCLPKDPQRDHVDIDWYGTVSELQLDGGIEVTLPGGRKVVTQLDKLSLLTEGYDSPEAGDDMELMGEMDEYASDYDDEATMWIDEEGQAVTERDDWEDVDVDDGDGVVNLHDDAATATVPEVADIVVSEEEGPVAKSASISAPDMKASVASPAADELMMDPAASVDSEPLASALPSDDSRWSRFEVLETAPADHAFINEPSSSAPSGAYFKRIQKEFKVLQTSLPDSILVRSYEDRSDLLRVLIVGSEGTPYEDAPFVIDFRLKPTYPQEPPVAHFHSWTNGSGRVSPNLYEEGKVCLSVLGTWSGQESESWSPTKSSLLQVFVSIQGLVLVREPWFTEPAYEKLKGTEEGEVNSALYSEKAFVLARGFVRRALEHPLEGLKDELEYLYFGGQGKGRLQKVMQRCKDLIAKTEGKKQGLADGGSEQAEAAQAVASTGQIAATSTPAAASEETNQKGRAIDEAISQLSVGSCIVLKRHLTAMEKLWETGRPSVQN